jgi:hypothetical protein
MRKKIQFYGTDSFLNRTSFGLISMQGVKGLSSLHSSICDSLKPRYEYSGQRSCLIKWEFFPVSERETGNKCNDA